MADGKRPTLDVEDRSERGTRAARRLRREGYVPGVVYGGKDGDCTSFKVNWRVLRQVLVDGSALIDLKVAGKTRPVIVKDQQQHPVRDELLHIDLLEVRLDEKIQTQVSVHLEGAEEAPGIKEGGVLEHVTHQLNIEALPTDIPDAIHVDVSALEIAATMHLSEISAPEGVTFLDDPEETLIATVVVPTEVEEPEIEEETELVGEEGELEEGAEPAEGEEGEAPAEGEAPSAEEAEGGGKADWLVVGLGNPGDRYARTRHNVGFEVAKALADRLGLPKFKNKYGGLYAEGRRVAVLLPQTYMNESGSSVGPARGALGVDLEHVLVVHDEIDLPFGKVEVRTGGGLAGHNGLKSVKRGLGGGDFGRVRVGVGRPDSTDPEIVSRYVLGRFDEDPQALIESAVDALERRVTSEE
jgi:aminoacyl-tRNA hydrolase/ribosomal protein bL25 (Ctc-form)